MPTDDTADAIYIALGANLDHPVLGGPRETLEAALGALAAAGVAVVARSRWYRTAPVPVSDQPWFVNGVARVDTALDAAGLLAVLHRIEADFGRVRGDLNAARTLDLDLLDYRGQVSEHPALPHPRMTERAFVLLPLADVAPRWRHPVTRTELGTLIAALPEGQVIEVVAEALRGVGGGEA